MEPSGVIHGDCLEVMRNWPDACVDLVFGSPPYADARTYGVGFSLKGQEWADWMAERVVESLRICRGLVAFVVEGRTKQFRWTAEPALLMADLHRRGVHLRKPPAFHRVGVPGSGGPDWLRNDYEFIVCATNGGKLPWSDNTAMGHPPKYADGGACSNRVQTRRKANGERVRDGLYAKPAIANPGNVIKCNVGGGQMGSPLAHENEAPFPEDLAEFFIRSFCPPDGLCFDPFCGSGTTAAVAHRLGRRYVTTDIRESQCELARRRLASAERELFT